MLFTKLARCTVRLFIYLKMGKLKAGSIKMAENLYRCYPVLFLVCLITLFLTEQSRVSLLSAEILCQLVTSLDASTDLYPTVAGKLGTDFLSPRQIASM